MAKTRKKYVMKRLQFKPINGLLCFNDNVQYFTAVNTTLEARILAIQQMRDDNPIKLKLLADYLVETRLPHWKRFRNGDDYKFCEYVFKRLTPVPLFESDLMNMERYVTVSIGGSRSASVRKYGKKQPCEIHPSRMGDSEGRCPTCIQRIKRLTAARVLTKSTPNYVIDKVLKLPSYQGKGRAGGFIKDAEQLVKSLVRGKNQELKKGAELDLGKPSIGKGLYTNHFKTKEITL